MKSDSSENNSFLKPLQQRLRLIAQGARHFIRELESDHKFWVNTLAIKGGASAIVVSGAVALTYAITLPFAAAATLLAVCAALVGVGMYGIATGLGHASKRIGETWRSLRRDKNAPASVTEETAPDMSAKNLPAKKFSDHKWVRAIADSKPARFVANSKSWKVSSAFVARQKPLIMGGMALSGAAVTVGLGVITLAAHLVVFPVVAVGSLLSAATVTTLWAASAVVSGTLGGIVAVKNTLKWRRDNKEQHKAALAKAAAPPDLPSIAAVAEKEVDAPFNKAAAEKDVLPVAPIPEKAPEKTLNTKDKPTGLRKIT